VRIIRDVGARGHAGGRMADCGLGTDTTDTSKKKSWANLSSFHEKLLTCKSSVSRMTGKQGESKYLKHLLIGCLQCHRRCPQHTIIESEEDDQLVNTSGTEWIPVTLKKKTNTPVSLDQWCACIWFRSVNLLYLFFYTSGKCNTTEHASVINKLEMWKCKAVSIIFNHVKTVHV
jgi:hypothetical protein